MRRRLTAALVAAVAVLAPSAPAVGQGASGPAGDLAPPPRIGATDVPPGWPAPPPVTADAWVLADLDTGQVLAESAAEEPRPVASTVKILTAISVLRRLRLDATVTAGPEVVNGIPDSASVGLDPGDTWRVDDLLEGLIARSGNDAAAALAVATGGTVEGFVGLMAEDAAAMGLKDVVLSSPDGLRDGNLLSADHLVDLTRAAMADPNFADLAARPTVELPGIGATASRNELLGRYPGAIGVKTGYTVAAGRCLVAAAERDGRRLLAVVLGSDGTTGHFTDATALLDHGFEAFEEVAVSTDAAELELKVPRGWVDLSAPPTDLLVPLDAADLVEVVAVPVEVSSDVHATATFAWHGSVVGRLDLVGSAPERPRTSGGAAVGEWLAGRAYAAMRGATAADAWEDGA